MKRKGEIAMLFNDLEDSQIERVVGGAFNKITGIQIKVSATGVGDNASII
ncbi:hypothetical protein G7B40_011345 [Aetokthonos hydrillicola Thurmond2011]|jgi:hypothetical protein|uniref:Uncharacterized protein n=1 Tax=Aetokthonos hydrillicola Thurmond2011 TaxID=2712845 RepID=A0AAP5M8X5_9CYAN|nr:hypothetical protein [Aetokthonos hydrillicola]MBO3460016.1 hypothetical protein [Aetokthonos hydrillicola CCALA 1050]MBW4584613.1 hypothetical protein [Aetokthonos hydrillicola CCALA 1050]MDR9895157.1 hypothetical protein [Aetokthonos hydrillicola Thurmond2011]